MKTQKRFDDDVEVVIFTKPACIQYEATHKAIKKLEADYDVIVDYELVDITRDSAARDYVLSLGYLQAPVVIVSRKGRPDQTWSGFRPDRIKQIMDADALYAA